MTDDDLIDGRRSCFLADVGGAGYVAAVTVSAAGSEYLVVAHIDSLRDDTAGYDAACSDVVHEQLGALPLEYVRRIAIASRLRRPPT
jgi:hypothetical protein